MSLPRYIVISDIIRSQIISGELALETQLPSQRELAEIHDTTLMTIRQALAYLEEDGMIHRRHGVGTFVSGETSDDFYLTGFSAEMEKQACEISTETLNKTYDAIHESASDSLGLETGVHLCKLERLRRVNQNPVVYQTSFLSQDLRKAVEIYAPESSLYNLLSTSLGQRVVMTREVILPIIVTNTDAVVMECSPNTPAFHARRLSFGLEGTPLVYDEAIISGRHFAITTERLGQRRNFMYHVFDANIHDVVDMLLSKD